MPSRSRPTGPAPGPPTAAYCLASSWCGVGVLGRVLGLAKFDANGGVSSLVMLGVRGRRRLARSSLAHTLHKHQKQKQKAQQIAFSLVYIRFSFFVSSPFCVSVSLFVFSQARLGADGRGSRRHIHEAPPLSIPTHTHHLRNPHAYIYINKPHPVLFLSHSLSNLEILRLRRKVCLTSSALITFCRGVIKK